MKERLKIDLTGRKFGRLTVLEYAGSDKQRISLWKCKCDCGNEVVVRGSSLTNKLSTSCGCYHRERISTHGCTNDPLYEIWTNMRQRCTNKNNTSYDHYGGRSICVCDEWAEFENFYDWSINHGYESRLSLDRMNNDGNYEPDNCRWVDRITQQNNRSINRRINFNGETHTLSEWSRILGVNRHTLSYRINHDNMVDFESYFNNRAK